MLLRHGVAVYDVIEQCSIIGSSDSSIKDVIPANLGIIVEASQIRKVYTNGKQQENFTESIRIRN